MTTDTVYDHSGLAPRLCAVIWRCGNNILELATRKTATKAEWSGAAATLLADLKEASEECQRGIDQLIGAKKGWLPSASLGVVVQDAWMYIGELEEFQPEGAMADEPDEDYIESLRDLAVEMLTRDHALEVAMRDHPERGQYRATGLTTLVMKQPGAHASPGDSNVVALDRFRRRRPARTSTEPTPAA